MYLLVLHSYTIADNDDNLLLMVDSEVSILLPSGSYMEIKVNRVRLRVTRSAGPKHTAPLTAHPS